MESRFYHIIIIGILSFSFFGYAKSQNYKVGIPINKFIASYGVKNGSECFSSPSEKVSFPYVTITGVTNILIFDSISPPNSIFVNPGHKIINTGDTLLITSSLYKYDFYFPGKANIKGKIYSIGTPKVVGEKYNCSDIEIKVLTRNCNTPVTYRYKDETCVGFVEE